MSPIEIKLVEALRRHVPSGFVLYDYTAKNGVAEHVDQLWHFGVEGDPYSQYEPPAFGSAEDRAQDSEALSLSIYRQVKIESYCIDLVLRGGCGLIFVECDGHEWHERTKQQAAYDRERDRLFLSRGLITARFTGSEIHHYPEKCASELYAILATSDRINTALVRNGFNHDGTSFRRQPTHALVKREDGFEFQAHWNPGPDPESGG
jgi:very-short-patch-repair endonuclease